MSQKIINDIEYLTSLPDDELNEILIGEEYNKANLRELIRRLLIVVNDYKEAYKYQVSEKEKLEDKLKSIIEKIQITR